MSMQRTSSLYTRLSTKHHLSRCLGAFVSQSHNSPSCMLTNTGQLISSRTFLKYTVKKGIDRDFLATVQQPIDLSFESVTRWFAKKKLEEERHQQRFQEERHKLLGPDLATAHFVLGRKGRVKFEGDDRWLQLEDNKILLPNVYVPEMKLEAVDASSTLLMYEGLDNFVDLQSFKYLDLSNCPMIDDWCLNKLETLQDTLLYLDISGCSKVTHKGLTTIHHLKNLRRLKLENMTGVSNMSLMTVLVEEMMPNCYVEGVHFEDAEHLMQSVDQELDSGVDLKSNEGQRS